MEVSSKNWQIEARLLKELVKMQKDFSEENKSLFSLYQYKKTPMILVQGANFAIFGKTSANDKLSVMKTRFDLPIRETQYTRSNFGECNTLEEMFKEFNVAKSNARSPITIVPNTKEKVINFLFKNKWERVSAIPFEEEVARPNAKIFEKFFDVAVTINPQNLLKVLNKVRKFKFCKLEVRVRDEKSKELLEEPEFRIYGAHLTNPIDHTVLIKLTMSVEITFHDEFKDSTNHLPDAISTVVDMTYLRRILNLISTDRCQVKLTRANQLKIDYSTKFNNWTVLLAQIVSFENQDVFRY